MGAMVQCTDASSFRSVKHHSLHACCANIHTVQHYADIFTCNYQSNSNLSFPFNRMHFVNEFQANKMDMNPIKSLSTRFVNENFVSNELLFDDETIVLLSLIQFIFRSLGTFTGR